MFLTSFPHLRIVRTAHYIVGDTHMIISVLNTKGGVGKSTTAINLAAGFAHRGEETLLLDTDKHGSAVSWASRRESAMPALTVVSLTDSEALRGQIGNLAGKYRHVIIDGAPALERLMTVSVAVADHVIIPVNPSPTDLWKLEPMVELVQRARELACDMTGKTIGIHFMLNRVQANTRLSREVQRALANYPFPVLRSQLGLRVDYADSLLQGAAAIEFANPKAQEEVASLLSEVVELRAA